MLKKLNQSSETFQTFVYTNIVTMIIFLVLIPLFFIDLKEIPLGILLGGFSTSVPYILFYFSEKSKHQNIVWTILIIIFTALWHSLVLIFAFLLYYHFNFKVFNVFAVFGSLFISLIIYVIINLVAGKREKRG